MKRLSYIFISLLILAGSGQLASAQTTSVYDQHELFNPVFFTHNGNEFRSANGAPGPQYWQNRADYEIRATLSEKDTTIDGEVTISYTNNSPDKMNFLWLQLDQNLFKPNSRGAATTPIAGDRFDVKGFSKGGYHIQSVSVIYDGKTYSVNPVITDARMQVILHSPLKSGGDKIQVKVKFSFAIPEYGADRMGRLDTKNGVVYEIAQWYPRICVYDDVKGWNTLPYMGLGEFYCEYGNFDYYITAPADMLVAGSGDLQNPEQVLSNTEIKRLNEARKSDSTIMIITKDEIGNETIHPKSNGMLTWHFKMENSRDVSWAASKAFMWDAAKINFPSGRKGIAMSVYPVESSGNDAYGRSTEYLKRSIEIYSNKYYEYPWNSAVSVAGVALGMEYPGIIFCRSDLHDGDLWGDVTHEIGHNWFPMLVGSNERRFMWQDEGFNTFINQYSTAQFNHGEYDNPDDHLAKRMIPSLNRERDPLMTPSESMNLNEYDLYYDKTALGLDMLRNIVLGPKRFDYAFNTYIRHWAFKHPQPEDFFRTMNDAAGEDLNWFWKEWFYKTWKLDQGIKEVKYVNDDPSQGALITLENFDKMAMPAIVQVKEENGNMQTITLPVEIWQRGNTWTFKYNSTSKIASVTLDPDSQLPDVNNDNDVWKK